MSNTEKNKTIGDICKNYKTGEAWQMIVASIVRKIKKGMDKKRFRVRGR
jgi:hypothetical protein